RPRKQVAEAKERPRVPGQKALHPLERRDSGREVALVARVELGDARPELGDALGLLREASGLRQDAEEAIELTARDEQFADALGGRGVIGSDLERSHAGVLLVRAAEARLAQNDAEGAVRALTRALEVDPDHATAERYASSA